MTPYDAAALSRRAFLAAAGSTAAAALAGCALGGSREPDSPTTFVAASRDPTRRRLRLRPPRLTDPQHIHLTDEYVAQHPSIDLYGPGRDWVIHLPEDRPLNSKVILHGRDEARNIVMIGGAITPQQHVETTSLRTSGGDWAVYALRGFTGATGGSFRIRTASDGAFTEALPWDATPAAMKAAIERQLGAGP